MFPFLSVLTTLTTLSLVSASTYSPTARWGQKAVYSTHNQAVYFVGGELSASNTQITNEVLVLPLNTTNPAFLTGPSNSLPPTAFGTLAIQETGTSSQLVYTGGLTSNCKTDAVIHTIDVAVSAGETSWVGYTPDNFLRRRGGGSFAVNTTTGGPEVLLVGGMIDDYVCSTATYAYAAIDTIALPISSTSTISTAGAPTSAFGSSYPVADFAIALSTDGSSAYMAGGADVGGALVDFTHIAKWDRSTGQWTGLQTTGAVPAGRAGHNMLVHPSQNILLMHGGAVSDNSTTSTPTALLSILDLSTLTWSTPSNLQPPASAARAWHSSVMTPQGVLISAFGMDANHVARNDVVYLDMRDTDQTKWGWKSMWSSGMLSNLSTTGSTTASSTASSTAASDHTAYLLKSILIPTLIVLFLGSPLIIYLLRRHVRSVRRRRMAQHFELDGENHNRRSFSSALAQSGAGRRLSDLRDLFSGDKPTPDGKAGFLANALEAIRLVCLGKSQTTRKDKRQSREMMEINANASGATTGPRVQWEEIDFGLGRVEEARRDSSIGAQSRAATPRPLKSALTAGVKQSSEEHRVKFEAMSDDAHSILIPGVQVQPPTPMGEDGPAGTPLSVLEYPVMRPIEMSSPKSPQAGFTTAPVSPFADPTEPIPPRTTQEPDWSNFARDLAANPLFSGPPSRSSQQTLPIPIKSPMMVLPPLEFQRRPSSGLQAGILAERRASTGHAASTPPGGRDLIAGNRRVSASSSQGQRATSPLSPRSQAVHLNAAAGPVSFHRLSNPPLFLPPSSPMPITPEAMSTSPTDERPVSRDSARSVSAQDQRQSRRASRLRVVNVSPDPNEEWVQGGRAL